MKENLSDLAHVVPAAKTLPTEEFLLPKEGKVMGDSPAGLYVDIKGKMFFCPYDRGGDLSVGETAYFSAIHYEQGIQVSYPQGVATIIQVVYSVKTAREMVFKELSECAREQTTFYPRVTSVLRLAIGHAEFGLKVTFSHGLLKHIPGLIPVSGLPLGCKLDQYIDKVVPALITVVRPPEHISSGHVEFSII
jgi:hypothetical protein